MIFYEFLFWFSAFMIFYTYIGYPLLVLLLLNVGRLRYFIRMPEGFGKIFLNPGIAGLTVLDQRFPKKDFTPFVSIIIAAYNEEKFIEQKIKNCLELDYPADKIEFLFVTDGSTDRTPEIVKSYATQYSNIKLFHSPFREGKSKAIQRVIGYTFGEILIFSDANAFYNREAIKFLVQPFQFEKVGCVAGEKRVIPENGKVEAESLYWKYESFLKRLDSELYSIVGAAGEIFAIRKNLLEKLPNEVINEDFILTMNVAAKGYRVIYEPRAYSIELPTKSIFEEFKRRVRISTGGIQAIKLLKKLFDIKTYKFLSFQFISHRILRWTITPISIILILISNVVLHLNSQSNFYQITFYIQSILYSLAFLGLIGELIQLRFRVFYLIFSFLLMNFASVYALLTYPFRPRTSVWEKPER